MPANDAAVKADVEGEGVALAAWSLPLPHAASSEAAAALPSGSIGAPAMILSALRRE
jgi:hypothetical protein